jgi:hypothetical protein
MSIFEKIANMEKNRTEQNRTKNMKEDTRRLVYFCIKIIVSAVSIISVLTFICENY